MSRIDSLLEDQAEIAADAMASSTHQIDTMALRRAAMTARRRPSPPPVILVEPAWIRVLILLRLRRQ